MQIVTQIRNIDKIHYFIIYTFASIAITFISNHILISEDLYYDFFGQQMSFERVTEFIDISKRLEWIIYIIIPIYLLLKFFIVAACLSVGVLLFGYNIEFKKLFHIALFADIIFIVPPIIKIFWFSLVFTDYNLADVQYFFPLSALSLVNPNQVEGWLIYPLQMLNIFEFLYWIALAFGLKIIIKQPFQKMLALVLSSYGLSLLLWVIFITFITINLS
jgi:hypothetical protein